MSWRFKYSQNTFTAIRCRQYGCAGRVSGRVSTVGEWSGTTRTLRSSTERCLGHSLRWSLHWYWSWSCLLFPRIRVTITNYTVWVAHHIMQPESNLIQFSCVSESLQWRRTVRKWTVLMGFIDSHRTSKTFLKTFCFTSNHYFFESCMRIALHGRSTQRPLKQFSV